LEPWCLPGRHSNLCLVTEFGYQNQQQGGEENAMPRLLYYLLGIPIILNEQRMDTDYREHYCHNPCHNPCH
jgi:hypothetical protein